MAQPPVKMKAPALANGGYVAGKSRTNQDLKLSLLASAVGTLTDRSDLE